MIKKFNYYLCIGSGWGYNNKSIFFGCNSKRGFIITDKGEFYPTGYKEKFNAGWHNGWAKSLIIDKQCKPSTFEECIKLIDKKVYKSNYLNIFKVLGIKEPDSKPIELTESTKKLVVTMLSNERAFNGDSAHRFNFDHFGEGVLDAMVELNLIKTIDNCKYFLDTDS